MLSTRGLVISSFHLFFSFNRCCLFLSFCFVIFQLEKAYAAVSLIEWDLPRTFPTLAFFHDGGAMHTGLERVLLCFALYRPDIGYVQVK